MKVAIVIPYFGRWPEWMDLYLYSCSRQKQMDFLFFTDCGIPKKTYQNTKFKEIRYCDYCKLVSERLNIKFSSDNPVYKLCGCKPFYGLIHKDDLAEYDFWGFGDIDLIYGNLDILVNEEMLCRYDFISTHSERVSGHLFIMRNTKKNNELCLKIPNWGGYLEDSQFHALDENFPYCYLVNPCFLFIKALYKMLIRFIPFIPKYGYYDFAQRIFQTFHKKSLFKEQYTTPVPQKEERWTYNISNGQMYDPTGKNIPYLHFLFFKKTKYFLTDTYWRNGFYKLPDNLDFEKSKGKIIISTEGITYKK